MNLLKRNATTRAKQFGYNYNIHNILKVSSIYELPELEYFRVPALTGEPDIRLRDPKFNWWQRLPVIARDSSGAVMQLAGADD